MNVLMRAKSMKNSQMRLERPTTSQEVKKNSAAGAEKSEDHKGAQHLTAEERQRVKKKLKAEILEALQTEENTKKNGLSPGPNSVSAFGQELFSSYLNVMTADQKRWKQRWVKVTAKYILMSKDDDSSPSQVISLDIGNVKVMPTSSSWLGGKPVFMFSVQPTAWMKDLKVKWDVRTFIFSCSVEDRANHCVACVQTAVTAHHHQPPTDSINIHSLPALSTVPSILLARDDPVALIQPLARLQDGDNGNSAGDNGSNKNNYSTTYGNSRTKKEENDEDDDEDDDVDDDLIGFGDFGALLQRPIPFSKPLDQNTLSHWSWNVFQYTEEQLFTAVEYMFNYFGLLERYNVSAEKMGRFIRVIRDSYFENPYHNFYHAVDVTQTVFSLLIEADACKFLTDKDIYAVLLSALGHDLKHPAVNNNYMTAADTSLAMLYNDVSVLENYHCVCLFEIFRSPQTNMLSALTQGSNNDKDLNDTSDSNDDKHSSSSTHNNDNVDKGKGNSGRGVRFKVKKDLRNEYNFIRNAIKSMILATDMKSHFKVLSDFDDVCKLINEQLLSDENKSSDRDDNRSSAEHADIGHSSGSGTQSSSNSGHSRKQYSHGHSNFTPEEKLRLLKHLSQNIEDDDSRDSNSSDTSTPGRSGNPPSSSSPGSPVSPPSPSVDPSSARCTKRDVPLLPRSASRLTMLKMLLHCADLSNPCKPYKLSKRWADLALEEYFYQGRLERAGGLRPSPNTDPLRTNRPKLSITFIDDVVSPLFFSLHRLLPSMRSSLIHLNSNRQVYHNLFVKQLALKRMHSYSSTTSTFSPFSSSSNLHSDASTSSTAASASGSSTPVPAAAHFLNKEMNRWERRKQAFDRNYKSESSIWKKRGSTAVKLRKVLRTSAGGTK